MHDSLDPGLLPIYHQPACPRVFQSIINSSLLHDLPVKILASIQKKASLESLQDS